MLLEEMEEFECEVGESSQLSPSDTAKKMGKEQKNNSMNKSTAAAATSRTTTTTAPAAECMRFLVRCALLAAALLTLFLLALLAIQQHNLERHKGHRTQQQSPAERRAAALAGQEPTEEEREARRLLLLAGNQPDEGVAVPASGQQLPQLETAVGAGLLFPIGRYPQGNRAAGAHGAGQLTLNVVVVLVVSLLSVAVLITAICCVIIIALAMDSATALEANRRGGSSASTDFLLASWPHLQMGAEASATGQLAKLFQRQPPDPFFEDNTPPLTDDELDQLDAADLELGLLGGASEREQQSYYDDRIPLVLEEEPESGRSWPAMAWGQLRRQRERREQAVATITTTSATAAGRAVISSRLPLEREQGNGRGQAPLGSTSIC